MLRVLFLFGMCVFLSAMIACSSLPKPIPTQTSIPPTSTAVPTPVPLPSLTPTLTRTITPTAEPTLTRTPTMPPGSVRIKIFLIALNDNGKSGKKIGCDDSVIAVERYVPATSALLTAALRELIAVGTPMYGSSGLYNALAQSSLKIESVSISNSKAIINLSGKVVLGGVCDNPRFEAQIRETALQFSTVKDVAVSINNLPLSQILSEK